jgi:hypothetical protein
MVTQVTQADLAAVRREIAELRGHVVRFKRALGVSTIEEAEAVLRQLRAQTAQNTTDITALQGVVKL